MFAENLGGFNTNCGKPHLISFCKILLILFLPYFMKP